MILELLASVLSFILKRLSRGVLVLILFLIGYAFFSWGISPLLSEASNHASEVQLDGEVIHNSSPKFFSQVNAIPYWIGNGFFFLALYLFPSAVEQALRD